MLPNIASSSRKRPSSSGVSRPASWRGTVATLRLARSTFAERLVAGRDIDPAALLRIDEALRQYMPTGEPAGVQFTIQVAKLCAKCGSQLDVEPPPIAEERPSASLNVVPLKQPQRSNNGGP